MQHRHPWLLVPRLGVTVFVLSVGAVACASAEDEPPAVQTEDRATANENGALAGAPSAGGGGWGFAGSSPLQLGGSDATLPGGASAVCQGETYEGKAIPVDMYFLVDSSTSMAEPVEGGTKWHVVSSALISFLNASSNTDGAVGIGYFPNPGAASCKRGEPGCACIPYTNRCASSAEGSCSAADYKPATELSLPSKTAQVVADLGDHQLSGGTPTRPAVEGTLQYLGQWAASHLDRRVVLVLATDGEPTGCDQNEPGDIANLAATAWSGPGIRTFVLGVGALLSSLDAVARAGGTDNAMLVETSGNFAQQFSDALEKIRAKSAVSCDFAIPGGEQGAKVDPRKVNVRAASAGGASNLVSQIFMSDPNNCGAAGGWYYDNPASPTAIKLCGSTCRELQSGSIQIQYGCDTIVSPPR